MKLDIIINGKTGTYDVKPNITLMQFLREHGYYSVKNGCNEGSCGSCTVLVNNLPRKSCIMFIGQVKDCSITTVEGLGTSETPHPLQEEFVKHGAVQCGYCIPGMILSAHALLLLNANPSEQDVKVALSGNLCRCTGYVKQIKSVQAAAKTLRENGK